MNIKLRANAKNEFGKNFFKLMNNSIFGKTMGNVGNHRDIKLVTSDKRRKQLDSEPNYHSHKIFSEHVMAIEKKKIKLKIAKPLYLGMPILHIGKTLMYEFWYDYINPKYGDKAKLCYTDTDSFIINIKTEDFFEDISNDVERWFDTSNYDKNDKRLPPIGKNKKVPGLPGKIMKEVVALRPKTYAYLIDGYSNDNYEKNKINKKAEGTKKCITNQKRMFENYEAYYHVMHTEKVNKIALSSNDDTRLQSFDWIIRYPHGTSEMMIKQS